MAEYASFYHDGFAWICRQCEKELSFTAGNAATITNIFTEGEAESNIPHFATKAIAKWADAARRFLTCPRCGVTEDTEVH